MPEHLNLILIKLQGRAQWFPNIVILDVLAPENLIPYIWGGSWGSTFAWMTAGKMRRSQPILTAEGSEFLGLLQPVWIICYTLFTADWSMTSFSLEPWRFISGPLWESLFLKLPMCETSYSDLGVLANHTAAIHSWDQVEIRLRWLVPVESPRLLVGWHKR